MARPWRRGATAESTLVEGEWARREHAERAGRTDGVQRHLIGEIIRRFEKKGFKLVGMKLMQASEDLLKKHYIALCDRPFYTMVSTGQGPLSCLETDIKCKETNPSDSRPGTIRGDFSIEVSKNVIHGSDSIESARREILLWFHTDKLTCWAESTEPWIYE
uniref:Nucleoside diphosphate kinase n=1 Tax=Gopherus agassizii TaxID=38772 RepID=A0A452IYN8_9SAUR